MTLYSARTVISARATVDDWVHARDGQSREHYGLDALVEYGAEEIPAPVTALNPAWREIDRQVRKDHEELKRYRQQQQKVSLEQPLSESAIQLYEQHPGHWQGRIEQLQPTLDQLKQKRKQTPRQIPVNDFPEPRGNQPGLVREHLARSDDARALLRQIYNTEVDLIADLKAKTPTVRLHHLTQAAHDAAVRHLCEELTATEVTFPGTDLRLVYKLGSA